MRAFSVMTMTEREICERLAAIVKDLRVTAKEIKHEDIRSGLLMDANNIKHTITHFVERQTTSKRQEFSDDVEA